MELLSPAQMEDFERVNAIARQVVALHASWGNGHVVEHPYPMDYYMECLREEKLYVARMDREVVGYILFYFWTAGGPTVGTRKMVSIDDLGVEETLRRRGIGKQMLADLQELARDRGCSGLQLYVDAPNENALAFYKKCGLYISNYGMQMKL